MGRFTSTEPWKAYEILSPNRDGLLEPEQGPRPVLDTLCKSGVPDLHALGKMHILLQLGWPDARYSMLDSRGRRLIARPDDEDPPIWLLKCKPSGWRIYFYVYEKVSEDGEKRILFLHAVDKDRWEESPSDAIEARQNFDRACEGAYGAVEFSFPDS